ncbi:MAG: hypothetical protein KDA75_04105, partial [Planctomycetaceae bacterium]|nr:hypothetical protein [Planctomycetaceae bacterium]
MEFRTCPACKASVLEDDAVDCPFCGASMTTGKPSSTGQAPARKAAPPSAAAAESKGPPAKPTAAAKTKSSASKAAGVDTGGDPFDVDTSAARKATPVRPRPAKGCMIRVTCPMCETPGFVSEAQIGKEVKCCNRECLVPVYVADAPQEKEPEPEPQPEGNSKLWMYVALGVLVVAGVGATFFLRGRKPPAGSGPIERPGTTAKNGE